MKILSRSISEKTEKIISNLCRSFCLPVKIFSIAKRPNHNDQVAGTVDAHGTGGIYSVWIDDSLPQMAFESDILHELHHITQVENGFSEVFYKLTSKFHSTDRSFIEEVGSHLSCTVLDIEVNNWLLQNGYDYTFFTEGNYNGLLKNSDYPYTELNDPLNFANLTLALLHASLYVDDTSASRLFDAYSTYPDVTACAMWLRKKLLSINIDCPAAALFAHGLLIDSMNVWQYYYAATPTQKIRTRGEYVSFTNDLSFLSDTKE